MIGAYTWQRPAPIAGSASACPICGIRLSHVVTAGCADRCGAPPAKKAHISQACPSRGSPGHCRVCSMLRALHVQYAEFRGFAGVGFSPQHAQTSAGGRTIRLPSSLATAKVGGFLRARSNPPRNAQFPVSRGCGSERNPRNDREITSRISLSLVGMSGNPDSHSK